MFSLKNKKYISLLFFGFLFFAARADAASLYIKPLQTEISVGNIVSVQVTVDTAGKIINNAEGIVQFPTDLLEVVSLDSKSSIFSLWVEEPSFSNGSGQITFNGGVPNPGYQGGSGKIISVTFRAKKAGVASIIFSNSAVRENDGLGTDILSDKSGSSIKISDVAVTQDSQEQEITATADTKNSAPVVSSSSHPKQDSWYSKSDIDLSWTLPANAKAVKTLLGSHPDSDPTVYYSKPISVKNIKNIDDGILYFHVNYLANDTWSKVAHFKIQIDTVDPTNLSVNPIKDDTGKITLQLKAEDELSGIDHFEIVPDKEDTITVKSDSVGEATSVISFTSAGDHKVVVTAYDKAGNTVETEINITTDFVAKLSIDSYPEKIKVNENIEVSGTAPYPSASLSVSLKKNDNVIEIYKIKSDSYSKFNFVSQPITEEGKYVLWVDVLRDNGEIRFSSEKVNIFVEKPLLLQIGSYTTELLSVLVPAVVMLIIFLFLIYYGWHKWFSLRRRMKKDFEQVETRVHNSFHVLYEEASKQLDILERSKKHRKLSSEETEAIEELKSAIMQMDTYIEKQIHKVKEDNF